MHLVKERVSLKRKGFIKKFFDFSQKECNSIWKRMNVFSNQFISLKNFFDCFDFDFFKEEKTKKHAKIFKQFI